MQDDRVPEQNVFPPQQFLSQVDLQQIYPQQQQSGPVNHQRFRHAHAEPFVAQQQQPPVTHSARPSAHQPFPYAQFVNAQLNPLGHIRPGHGHSGHAAGPQNTDSSFPAVPMDLILPSTPMPSRSSASKGKPRLRKLGKLRDLLPKKTPGEVTDSAQDTKTTPTEFVRTVAAGAPVSQEFKVPLPGHSKCEAIKRKARRDGAQGPKASSA